MLDSTDRHWYEGFARTSDEVRRIITKLRDPNLYAMEPVDIYKNLGKMNGKAGVGGATFLNWGQERNQKIMLPGPPNWARLVRFYIKVRDYYKNVYGLAEDQIERANITKPDPSIFALTDQEIKEIEQRLDPLGVVNRGQYIARPSNGDASKTHTIPPVVSPATVQYRDVLAFLSECINAGVFQFMEEHKDKIVLYK